MVLVHHQVAGPQVAEVGQEAAQAAAALARVQVHLLREDVPVGQHQQPGLGQLEARGERPHARLESGLGPGREALLSQDLAQALGPATAAEEEHDAAGRAGLEVGHQGLEVAGVGSRRTAGQVLARGAGLEVVQAQGRSGVQALGQRLGRHEGFLRVGQQDARAPGVVGARALVHAAGLLGHGLGLEHHRHGLGEVLPGRTGGAGHQRDEIGQLFPAEAVLEPLEQQRQAALAGEALGQQVAQARGQRAGREDVGQGQQLERVDLLGAALGAGVEAPQALEGVAEELQSHGLLGLGREDVEDAPAARHLARCGDRVLVPVATLVEGLEQDLGRHLLAAAQGHHAGLEQPGRQGRAQQAGGRGHQRAQPAAAGRVQRGGPLQGGLGVALQAAEGSRVGGREEPHGAALAQLLQPGAQVGRHGLEVPLAGRHDEQRLRAQQERDQQPGRALQPREVELAALLEGCAQGLQARRAGQLLEPGAHGRRVRSISPVVERPASSSTRTTRPPAASTTSAPTIVPGAQSAPLTSTSGSRAWRVSSGVSCS